MRKLGLEGIIVWRRKPELVWQEVDDGTFDNLENPKPTPGHWRVSFRCAVIPMTIENEMPIKEEGAKTQFI